LKINQLLIHGPNVSNAIVPDILFDASIPSAQQGMLMKDYVHELFLRNGLTWRVIYATVNAAKSEDCITLIHMLKQFVSCN